jgi:two-component system cell cycle response regulator DivK
MKLTALVIDDNENNRELISFILSYYGYNVIFAENGLEGLDLAKKELPDFIILDVQLPDIDGFEVLGRIRDDKSLISIPVIVMSSYDLGSNRKRVNELENSFYMEKPLNPDTIIGEVESIIQQKSVYATAKKGKE